MKKTVLLIVILIMAGLISGLVLNMRINRHSSSPGFTIKYKVTRVGVDGNTIECDETRYVSSNGSFYDTETLPFNGVKETYFVPEKGVFKVNRKLQKMQKVTKAAATLPSPPTADQLKNNKQFIETKEILGYQTYLLRTPDPDTNLPAIDTYYAAEFPFSPIKTVCYDSKGKTALISEAIDITIGEPDKSVFDLPNFPIVNDQS